MGLALEIQVESADDNARVDGNRLMQTHEVPAIQGEDDPPFRGREIEYGTIGQRLTSLSKVTESYHVVAETPEHLDDREWEVLVGKQACHQRYAASFSRICSSSWTRCART